MIREELHNKKDLIISIAKKYGAQNVQIFGSVARAEETENSDIDILVSMQKGYDIFNQRIPLQAELIHLLGRKVDLLVRYELNRHLKVEILANAIDI